MPLGSPTGPCPARHTHFFCHETALRLGRAGPPVHPRTRGSDVSTATHFAVLPATLTAAALLTACGGDSEEFNDADVTFAQEMIPHHEQAIEMSTLADEGAGSNVADLAERIEDAQGPEIERLTAMLDEWGEEPMTDGHGDHAMDGMLSDDQMAQLADATEGDEFDTLFLELMIAHHEGAVSMAEDQLDNGTNPEASEMATEIVDTQDAEITEMRDLLDEPAGGDTTEDEADSDHSGH